MKKFLKVLDEHAEDVLAVILMSAATLIIVIQVIMRYLFKSSLSWSEEMARYLFVWMTFISISYGIKMRKHVKIEAALSLFPKNIRPLIVIVGDILSLVWCIFVTVVGFNLIGKVVRSGQISPALSVPKWLIYLAPCIGYALATIRCIQTIALRVKNYKEGVEMND